MDLAPQTSTYHTALAPIFPSAPGFTFQLTRMKDTLLVWVGTTGGEGAEEERTVLAADWAVAMPSRGASPESWGSVLALRLCSGLIERPFSCLGLGHLRALVRASWEGEDHPPQNHYRGTSATQTLQLELN